MATMIPPNMAGDRYDNNKLEHGVAVKFSLDASLSGSLSPSSPSFSASDSSSGSSGYSTSPGGENGMLSGAISQHSPKK